MLRQKTWRNDYYSVIGIRDYGRLPPPPGRFGIQYAATIVSFLRHDRTAGLSIRGSAQANNRQ